MKVMTAPPAGLYPLARDATSLGEPPPGSSGNIRTAAPVMHSQERAGRRLRHGFPQEQTMGNDNATTAAPGRRRILKCMAAAGAGTLWLMNGGVLKAYAMGHEASAAQAAADATFSFVQVSDSHIGFRHAPNMDVAGTLAAAVARINARATPPDFVIHTGDLTHLSRPDEFETVGQLMQGVKTARVLFVPGEHDVRSEER